MLSGCLKLETNDEQRELISELTEDLMEDSRNHGHFGASFKVPMLLDDQFRDNLWPDWKCREALASVLVDVICPTSGLLPDDFSRIILTNRLNFEAFAYHVDLSVGVLGVFADPDQHKGTEFFPGFGSKYSPWIGARFGLRKLRKMEEEVERGDWSVITTQPGDLTLMGPKTVHCRSSGYSKKDSSRVVMFAVVSDWQWRRPRCFTSERIRAVLDQLEA